MTLFTEIITDFTDGNHLVTPGLCPPGTQVGSDNGPMFTSEFYIMLKRRNEADDYISQSYQLRIWSCISPEGLLNRVPVGQKASQTGPDDYYEVLNGCKHYNVTSIPRAFLAALIRYGGFLNNVTPGEWNREAFLVRQPQLVAAMISAGFPSLYNPLHWLIRLLCFPLYLYSALVIAISCVKTEPWYTDERRLAWHLLRTVSPVSLLCTVASKLWFKRLHKDYPWDDYPGMRGVAYVYYTPNGLHPFARYWVD